MIWLLTESLSVYASLVLLIHVSLLHEAPVASPNHTQYHEPLVFILTYSLQNSMMKTFPRMHGKHFSEVKVQHMFRPGMSSIVGRLFVLQRLFTINNFYFVDTQKPSYYVLIQHRCGLRQVLLESISNTGERWLVICIMQTTAWQVWLVVVRRLNHLSDQLIKIVENQKQKTEPRAEVKYYGYFSVYFMHCYICWNVC